MTTSATAPIRYWCMRCPETFTDAATSNAHHEATGHHQTWREGGGFVARQANALRAREAAWTANPHCTECGRVIESPEAAGLIETTQGARVACRRPCFALAVSRLNPTMNRAALDRRAGGQ